MQIRKDRIIDVFGSKWKIKYVDKVLNDDGDWVFGIANADERTVYISTVKSSNKPLSDNEIDLTLYHELMHVILITGQYMNCNGDEPLVEWLARCLVSLNKQKVF